MSAAEQPDPRDRGADGNPAGDDPGAGLRRLVRRVLRLAAVALACLAGGANGAEAGNGTPTAAALPGRDRIFQFFAPSQAPRSMATAGAYLWIPPRTPRLRAVLVGIHNGLPLAILQHPAIRDVCRRHGIGQVLMTPNGSDIGPVMLKDLDFDVTDPARTAVYDRYLGDLARLSGHPELLTAPVVPLAHSAYMSFAFDLAMRRPEQCLGAIPIKAGTPDAYAFYGPGGKAKTPDPSLCLRGVPLLVIDSAAQETVVSRWKGSPYPQLFEPNFLGAYRRDRNDNPGTGYEPRNEMIGACWDMLSGHFDMLERDYRFVAEWLDAIATARLPGVPGAPLAALTLRDGWLMDPHVPRSGAPGPGYPPPARYLEFTGDRSRALWFPTAALAQGLFRLQLEAIRREVEVFTVCDAHGRPVSLSETPMAVMPDAYDLLEGDGRFTIATSHFTAPPLICSVQAPGHGKRPDDQHDLGNPLFPGKATLPVSRLPLRFDPNGGPLDVLGQEEYADGRGVTETRFTVRLSRNRLWPDGGYQMLFPRLSHDGDERFLPTGRTIQLSWTLDSGSGAAEQTVTFPPVPDVPATAAAVPFAATSSSGLPVDYFVVAGPGVIRDGAFIPLEVPAGAAEPIAVTVGAYQVGLFRKGGGVKPSRTVYQTFRLLP